MQSNPTIIDKKLPPIYFFKWNQNYQTDQTKPSSNKSELFVILQNNLSWIEHTSQFYLEHLNNVLAPACKFMRGEGYFRARVAFSRTLLELIEKARWKDNVHRSSETRPASIYNKNSTQLKAKKTKFKVQKTVHLISFAGFDSQMKATEFKPNATGIYIYIYIYHLLSLKLITYFFFGT